MSKVKKQPSFKAYAAMWIAIIAAYAVWMIAFMRKIVLVNYATVEERTVDGITHANISGMMGHEWLYPIWVAVSCICLAMFIVYIKVLLYGKEPGKALKIFCLFGVILGSIGSAAIYVTINCPSMGEEIHLDSARCMAHWTGALLFAFCCAAPMVLLLINKAREFKGRFLVGLIVFCAILLTMLVLLLTVGKSAIIENIPMQAAYVLLFLLNFTNIFPVKKAEKAPAKEAATV
mgnify:CR=1 FL=1